MAEFVVDEEISIGDFVLTGGEIPAMLVVDSRQGCFGVLGMIKALLLNHSEEGYLEFPHTVSLKNSLAGRFLVFFLRKPW